MALEKEQIVTDLQADEPAPASISSLDQDEELLKELGYTQQFQRKFGLLQSFSVAASLLGLLPSIASTLGFNFGYSGSAGAVWGWLVACIPIQFVGLSLAEICSSMPTDGGLYYAAAVLAPEGWGPLAAWFVGWANILGISVGPLSLAYTAALMVFGAVTVHDPTFAPQDYQIWLLSAAFLIFEAALVSGPTVSVGYLNVVSMAWNMGIVLVFVIWVLAGKVGDFNTHAAVWTELGNGTSWPTGWAFMLGFTSVLYTLAGYDTPFHLSEECSNASLAGPRAIVMTTQSGLWFGWAIIIAMAYTITDITEVISGPYGQPMVNYCVQVLGPKAGLALLALTIVAQLFVIQGAYVYLSRIIFAYSRDDAIIGSRWWKKINPVIKTPINALWLSCAYSILLGLLVFAGPITINAVFSVGALGQNVAYGTPIALKLFFGQQRFVRGPWHLGRLSRLINAVSVAFISVVIVILVFPAVSGDALTPQTMNWTVLIWGGPMILAMLRYAIDGRKWFKGPNFKGRYAQAHHQSLGVE